MTAVLTLLTTVFIRVGFLIQAVLTRSRDNMFSWLSFRRKLQFRTYTCLPTCVEMVLQHFGQDVSNIDVQYELGTTPDGTSLSRATKFLRSQGYRVGERPRLTLAEIDRALRDEALVIAEVDTDHVLVMFGASTTHYQVADDRRDPRTAAADG